MKCPHCGGELKKAPRYVKWNYLCQRCGRGWIIQGDLWFACFDAGRAIYKKTKKGFKLISAVGYREKEGEKLWENLKEALKNEPRKSTC